MSIVAATKSFLYRTYERVYRKLFYQKVKEQQAKRMFGPDTIEEWERMGKPFPPPAVYKHRVLRAYRDRFNLRHLVETGTFTGKTVDAMKNDFTTIHSVEIDKRLHRDAANMFRKFKHIKIMLGDSKDVLPLIMKEKTGPALYWLDGHYSWGITSKGEKVTPIMEELKTVLSHFNNDVILIDDARLFAREDYPPLDQLLDYVRSFNLDLNIYNHNDIVRIHRGDRVDV
jgi:hypothetical protein